MRDIYVITTVRFVDNQLDDQRPVGFFIDYDEALLRVENNSYDIFEDGYYKYAAIVKISEGLYPSTEEIQWFEYCKITNNVVQIKKPKILFLNGQEFKPYILG